ncbi:MAG: transporter ATP-binding protein [Microvirga sp.]|jgi:branched-chain amino acid transport system ATP-binding protein|nr:transporter ATP-binding protein [Microvirga sp.]
MSSQIRWSSTSTWEEQLLSVRELTVHYGGYLALSEVSLEVGHREIVCVMGANGSGKSTLLNAVSGLVESSGEILFEGRLLQDVPTYERLALGLAHVLERRRLFPFLTVSENLLLGAYLPSMRSARAQSLERVESLFPILRDRRRQLAHSLSGGEQQQVAIARALMGNPRFLMLDEPFLGLSPKMVAEISRVIQSINQDGVTVLFNEQSVQQSLGLSDRGYILESGRVALAGASAELLADRRLHSIYMGLAGA